MLVKENQGFVLITVLALLSLLTVLSIGLYFVTLSTQQDSAIAVKEEQARYYAETGMSYVKWAFANDADLDVTDVVARAPAAASALFVADPTNDPTIGDREEWAAIQSNPGPTSIGGTDGAIMYFDNSPLDPNAVPPLLRAIQFPIPAAGVTMRHISAKLPRYIRIDIGAAGTITSAIPPMPHNATPVAGIDIPLENGAVVWFTAGNAASDFALDPTLVACGGALPVGMIACRTAPAAYIASYSIVVYSLGYVGGEPLSLIRSILM